MGRNAPGPFPSGSRASAEHCYPRYERAPSGRQPRGAARDGGEASEVARDAAGGPEPGRQARARGPGQDRTVADAGSQPSARRAPRRGHRASMQVASARAAAAVGHGSGSPPRSERRE